MAFEIGLLGLGAAGDRLVEFLFGDRAIFLVQFLRTDPPGFHILLTSLGGRHPGLGLLELLGAGAVFQLRECLPAEFQLALGRLDLELDRVGQQLRERLPFGHAVAFVERKFDHAAVDRAADRGVLRGHYRADERLADCDFSLNNRRDDDQRRLWWTLGQTAGGD